MQERRRESGGLREARSSTAARAGGRRVGRRVGRVAACWCNAVHSEQGIPRNSETIVKNNSRIRETPVSPNIYQKFQSLLQGGFF